MLYRPVEGTSPFAAGRLHKRGAQGSEPRQDLLARPFSPVAGALARDTGLLQALGLFFEPHGALQVRNVSIEVLADEPYSPRFQDRLLPVGFSIVPLPEGQALEHSLQARRPERSQENLRGSEKW